MIDRRSASWRFFALLLCTLGIWLGNSANADPRQWGSSGVPIRQGHHIEWYRAAHRADDGHTMLVWSDTRTGDRDVYAQLLDPQGDIAAGWPEDGLSVIDFDYRQEDPEPVAVTGGFVIAWIEFRHDSTGDVFAQKLDYQGTKLWNPNGVLVDTHVVYMVNETSLRCAHDGQGGAIIAWEDARRGDLGDIYAQRVTSSGTRAWAQVLPVTDHNGYQKGITADGDGQGNMIVAWNDPRDNGSDIYAAKITPQGTLPWGGLGGRLVSNAAGLQSSVKICPDLTTGGAYLAWVDDRAGASFVDLYMQKLDAATGNSLWQEDGILLCDAENAQRGVRVAVSMNGGVQDGVITCWDDVRVNGEIKEVYAQKTNAAGVHQWAANGVMVCGTATQTGGETREGSRLTSDNQGGGLYVWDDTRVSGDILQFDCYIAHLNSSGQHLCGECGDPVATEAHQQTEALIRLNGTGSQVIVVYQDMQRGSKTLRYKKVDLDDCEAHDAPEIIFGLDGNVKDPVNIMISPGRVAYAWEDNRGGNNGKAVFYHIMDTTGVYPFDFIPQNGDTIAPDNQGQLRYDQTEPAVCLDGSGGFFCAFLDLRGSAKQVRLTRVGDSGEIVCPLSGTVAAPSTADQLYAFVVEDGEGGCYVGWSNTDTSFQMDVFVMRMGADCQPMWSLPILLSSNPSQDDILQGLVSDQNGNAIAVWTTGGFQTLDVKSAKIGPDGTIIWSLPISAAPLDQGGAQVICDNQGGAYYVWEDSRNFDIADVDVYAQHVNSSGQIQWTNNGSLIVTAPELQKIPRLAVDPDGFLYIIWQDYRTGTHLDIYGQKLTPQGQRQWPTEGRLICGQNGDQSDQQLLLEWANGWYMVWVDNRSSFYEDLYGAHFNTDGDITDGWWGTVGSGGGAINTEYQRQDQPSMAHDFHGGSMICWVDWRSSGKEPLGNLWGNWINDGSVDVREIPAPLPREYRLTQNYPNPFNPSTHFEFTVPLTEEVKIRVFNSLGQEVKTLVNKVMLAGTYRVEFNASALASGTYFYRLETPSFQTVKKMTLLR